MSDFACLIYLTGIYPVCHTALLPSNDVSHQQKKLVNKQEKNPADESGNERKKEMLMERKQLH
jgi:hypothetical protein